jgi:SARP family transcriptional regulator, regulator of embCAB operon
MEFQLLGSFEACVGGRPVLVGIRRQERLLLAILVLEAGRVVSIARLADLLWDGTAPPTARSTLHTYVGRLRRTLSPHSVRILTRGEGYLFDEADHVIDAGRFTDLVHRATAEMDPTVRPGLLDEALTLWRGPLLADLADDRLRERLGSRLTDTRLASAELLAESRLTMGLHDVVAADLEPLAEEYPTRERLLALLMTALYRCERQADAIQLYRAARSNLVSQLGVEPGSQLRDLHVRILRNDPTLDRPSAPRYAVRVRDEWLPWKAAGHPALEFCNTLAGWGGPPNPRNEWLRRYDTLAVWPLYMGLADDKTVARLIAAAKREPAEAARALTEARLLRSHLYACLTAKTGARSFAVVARYAEAAAKISTFVEDNDGLGRWQLSRAAGLRLPVYAAARCAADLLGDPRRHTVRRCPGDDCGWLFLDQNGLRQWCSMGICGATQADQHDALCA